MNQKRTSKAEWLEKALEVLEAEGVNGVKINRLAKLLETSRSGFYWHFKGRSDLLNNFSNTGSMNIPKWLLMVARTRLEFYRSVRGIALPVLDMSF